jgi:hypothetical protein
MEPLETKACRRKKMTMSTPPSQSLTIKLRKSMIADYIAGMPIKQIANKYNIHQSYPAVLARRLNIPRRRTWTNHYRTR